MITDKAGIIFSAIMGSKVTDSIPRFTAVQNELMKHVLPPIPFLGFRDKQGIHKIDADFNAELWTADKSLNTADQFFPFSFKGDDGVNYLLPYEPMISINGKNSIVRRKVAKAKSIGTDGKTIGGTIKERWTQDDYEITITGVLIGSILTGNSEQCFPRADFARLVEYMTTPKSLKVFCEPLQLLGINQIVIEEFSFPFTKGENVQAYEIKAYSDFDYKLLLKLDD